LELGVLSAAFAFRELVNKNFSSMSNLSHQYGSFAQRLTGRGVTVCALRSSLDAIRPNLSKHR
jgi:hypothetical protein